MQGGTFSASRDTVRLVAVDWKRLLIEVAFLALLQVTEPLFQQQFYCNYADIHDSYETLQLFYFNIEKLVKIYLILNNFKNFFLEKITAMVNFFVCIALHAY